MNITSPILTQIDELESLARIRGLARPSARIEVILEDTHAQDRIAPFPKFQR